MQLRRSVTGAVVRRRCWVLTLAGSRAHFALSPIVHRAKLFEWTSAFGEPAPSLVYRLLGHGAGPMGQSSPKIQVPLDVALWNLTIG